MLAWFPYETHADLTNKNNQLLWGLSLSYDDVFFFSFLQMRVMISTIMLNKNDWVEASGRSGAPHLAPVVGRG